MLNNPQLHQSFIKSAISPMCFSTNRKNTSNWFLNRQQRQQRKLSFPSIRVKAVMKSKSGTSKNNPKSQNVKALVTVTRSAGGLLTNLVRDGIQGIGELVGKTLVLELVSNELDPGKFLV